MDKRYARVRALVKELEGCGSGACRPRVRVEWDGRPRLAWVWEESFPSRAAARREAERALEGLYRQAEEKFRAYTDPRWPEGFCGCFLGELNGRLSALREALGRCRTERTAALVNRFTRLMTPEAVSREMAQISADLVRTWPMPGLDSCRARIAYEQNDPSQGEEGLFWLAAKAFVRWGCDLWPAVRWMEEEAGRRLEAIQKAFDAQAALSVSRHITAPVQARLPLLGELLDREQG